MGRGVVGRLWKILSCRSYQIGVNVEHNATIMEHLSHDALKNHCTRLKGTYGYVM